MADAVRVEGLANLRKTLRNTDKDALKMVQGVVKGGAEVVSAQAAVNAPKGTRPMSPSRRPQKRLAEAYRATTSGNKGLIRNPLVHARIFEYRKTGTPAQMRGAAPVERAIEAKQSAVTRSLEVGFEVVARRNGWR